MTRPPSAPSTMSSHMKPKRSCPGVPNRYSFRVGSTVMQPKSIATVVVVLRGVWLRSSTPAATSVMAASVVSGSISEMEPTAVVLPTPKPPAITILTASGGRTAAEGAAEGRAAGSVGVTEYPSGVGDGAQAVDEPAQDGGVVGDVGVGYVHRQLTGRAQVLGEDPHHVQVQPQPGRDLRDGLRYPARGDDVVLFEGEPVEHGESFGGGHHLGLDGHRPAGGIGCHPAGGDEERPYGGHRAARLTARRRAAVRHGCASSSVSASTPRRRCSSVRARAGG